MKKIKNIILYIPKKIGMKLLEMIAFVSAIVSLSYSGNFVLKAAGGFFSTVKFILKGFYSYIGNDLTPFINEYAGSMVIRTVPNIAKNLVQDTINCILGALVVYLFIMLIPLIIKSTFRSFKKKRRV